ncbi:unnamed protein product [Porites lobata]|uniref:Endonuclease/exonuclease/phosphatase domain-containing protein n=1 Tax=Porites lobata TaxID=104759 RepID=A0ABN8QGN5_9CNID|nr:unnamed protein product [Porites lobata]
MFCRLMNRLAITRFIFPVTRSFAVIENMIVGLVRAFISIIQSLENLCIEIHKPRSKPFLIVTWYRPTSSSTEIFSHLETLIGKLDSENAEFYLMGDFN